MNIKKNLTDLIGNTPLLELSKIGDKYDLKAKVIAKLESFNPGGSVKDRIGLAMIQDAEQKGILKPGSVIIEPTSGNTGIGLSWIACIKNYRLILTMPESMSVERRNLLKARGAELVLTPAAEGMGGAIRRAEQLKNEIDNAVVLGQFDNMANPEMHYNTTANEIWQDTDGTVDIVVAGVGTGGTLSGIAKRLKELKPEIKIIAVEPDSSPVLSGEKPGPHKIQGIGAGFVPNTCNTALFDEVIRITNDDAFDMHKELTLTEGVFAGISSGAAVAASIKIAQRTENANKNIVAILPDTGERYLSMLI